MAAAVDSAPEFANIQGFVVRGYTHPVSRHFLFHFPSSQAGRNLIRHLLPQVCNASTWGGEKPECLINFGISHAGLKSIGLPQQMLDAFPEDFKDEPDPGRMGDVGSSHPDNWWQRRFETKQIHAVVHLFARDAEILDQATAGLRQEAGRLQLMELLPADGRALEGKMLPDHRVHFGYRDGLSQPNVDWGDGAGGRVDFRHFLLGYSNQQIRSAPDGAVGELLRDSSYAGLRWLSKDVAAFNAFLESEGPKLAPGLPRKEASELLAAKLLGRWRDGTPLALSPDRPNPALAKDNFGYADDPAGEKCPVSAHIRIVNPRDQELDFVVVDGVPPLIRRGTPYGPELEGRVDDGQSRGLIGIFICASILRQFYVLTSWMKRNDFSPLFSNVRAQDPFANRKVTLASSEFTIPWNGASVVTVQLQDFSTTLGTAFFLLPSIKALEYLTTPHA
jgi:Dyp-type peroxidase family